MTRVWKAGGLVGSSGIAALLLSGTAALAGGPIYATEEAFVAAMAHRMTELGENNAIYAEEVAAERCLNYISGAHGTESLRQEIGRTNRDFVLSATQEAEFESCVREEGYRLR